MANRDKKILLLGGSYAQLPAVRAAKEKGLYIVLCDYLPDNPGQEYADEYYNVSTTDKEEVLQLAIDLDIDYVWAYASDPAAPTAAFVAEEMGLPGNSYKSVQLLSEKHLFRELLKENGLNGPRCLSLNEKEAEQINNLNLRYPLIVKPVDSSGSKGVRKIESFTEFSAAAEYALGFSRSNKLIAEEYIESDGPQIHGDGFVVDGELVFTYLGDHHYNKEVNPFVPYSTTWPTVTNKKQLQKLKKDVNVIISKSRFENGPVNIEARVDNDGELYIMEVGPRSGGNFVPQVIEQATGFDMVKASLQLAMGKNVSLPEPQSRHSAYYVIHSKKDGELVELDISDQLDSHIHEFHQYLNVGETVNSFQGANAAIGVLLLLFDSRDNMEMIMKDINKYISLEVL